MPRPANRIPIFGKVHFYTLARPMCGLLIRPKVEHSQISLPNERRSSMAALLLIGCALVFVLFLLGCYLSARFLGFALFSHGMALFSARLTARIAQSCGKAAAACKR